MIEKRALLAVLLSLMATLSLAQPRPDPASVIAAQREAMKAFASMDGVWRGPAWTLTPDGQKHTISQTERIGPFLDGLVKVIEGRGYGEGDKVTFNALGIISYDPTRKAYSMRSYALGRAGDFAFAPTRDGYTWEIPAGGATIRYTATIKGDTLTEVGDRIVQGREPLRFFEMRLKRVGDSDWPETRPVPMR